MDAWVSPTYNNVYLLRKAQMGINTLFGLQPNYITVNIPYKMSGSKAHELVKRI